MEASVATLPRTGRAEDVRASAAATPWVLYAVLFGSTSIIVGLIWDISWHMTIGRDSFLTPAHLAIYLGGVVAGIACGWVVLKTTFAGTPEERAASVRFWGFRGPLGAWVCIWGAFAMLTSAPFDDWWHNAYGLDVEILSPPHTVLALGMMGLQLGAMLLLLAAQNRAGVGAEKRYRLMYGYAAGILVAMAAILGYEYASQPNGMHGSFFYKITALVFPFFLVAVARASRLRWPATVTAAVYMGIMLLMMWILPLFPASARLGPIYNPVDRMVPMDFPLLLVFPALAIDLLMRRWNREHGWPLAAMVGVAFVLVMVATHWFWAEFMLSPAARNPLFAGDTWSYMVRPGEWQHEFWTLDTNAAGEWSPLRFAQGLGIAAIFGMLSARAGLWWGGWMARVRR